jgi:hypothetical protein
MHEPNSIITLNQPESRTSVPNQPAWQLGTVPRRGSRVVNRHISRRSMYRSTRNSSALPARARTHTMFRTRDAYAGPRPCIPARRRPKLQTPTKPPALSGDPAAPLSTRPKISHSPPPPNTAIGRLGGRALGRQSVPSQAKHVAPAGLCRACRGAGAQRPRLSSGCGFGRLREGMYYGA